MEKIKKTALLLSVVCCLLQARKSYADDCNVRLLVLYTQAALARAGSSSYMYTAVKNAVAGINTSFANSGINHTIVLAGIRQLRNIYTEPGCYYTMMEELEATNDTYLDEVHSLRDQYRADLVALVVDDSSRCGLADNTMGADHAFILVYYDCMLNNWSLAREVGYLYQCGNNENELESEGAVFDSSGYANAYGYYYDDFDSPENSFSTIMAYTDESRSSGTDEIPAPPDYDLIPYWSNPDISYNNIPIGDAEHNNAAVIMATGQTLANYRVNNPTDTLEQDTVKAYEYISGIAIDTLFVQMIDVQGNGNFNAVASSAVFLQPGFHAESGSSVDVKPDSNLKTCVFPDQAPPGVVQAKMPKADTSNNKNTPWSVTSAAANTGTIVYPNPFTDQVTISYLLTGQQTVSLFIYDMNGNGVTALKTDELQSAGRHQAVFNAAGLTAGVYVYQLIIDAKVETGKIIKGE